MTVICENEKRADVAGQVSIKSRLEYHILHSYPEPFLESKWLGCLNHAVDPAHYASPAFFKELYFKDKKPFAVLATRGEEVVGVLTGLHEGQMVVSGLESRVHIALDARHDANDTMSALARGVEQEAEGSKVVQVYSWSDLELSPLTQIGYRKRRLIGNPVLNLGLGADTLLKQLGTTHRRNIKLAAKNGVEASEVSTREDFDAFYAVYDAWCTMKKLFKYPNELEWEIFQTTKANRRLFVAKKDGQVIAGTTIRFFPGGLVEYSRNSSRPEFLHTKPNDLLMWHAIRWSCENAFSHYSMGAHHKFLRGFGGTLVPIDRYRIDRTLFRKHDLNDLIRDTARKGLASLPPAYETRIRSLLGKTKPEGW
jgi:hypothetical protein